MKVQHTLHVSRREKTGTRYARRERAAGKLPAVLYGHGKESVSLSLDHKEALKFFHSGERVFDIEVQDESVSQTVMLKDIQFDYLGTNPVHVDLTRVDMNEEVDASVELRFVGQAVGMKETGAVFSHPSSALHIRAAVKDLPDHIDVNITDLEAHHPIYASDVTLPEGIVLLTDARTTVAVVTIKAEQATETTEAEDVEGAPAQPEVITEKKEEAEDKEG